MSQEERIKGVFKLLRLDSEDERRKAREFGYSCFEDREEQTHVEFYGLDSVTRDTGDDGDAELARDQQ